ncbi:MAG: shikimate dehydrogenase [Pelagibacterales bacterium]|nr:shikimate dehydrogenase [Pelagibacterales bacterium]|tara:strand:- start:8249 stop:9091 length:843 start_codon:yes stop_codon:yes gene_type:complete
MTTGIIGKPIKHSLSPVLHSFWLRMYDIESTYKIYEIEKNDISRFLKSLEDNNIDGLNVTIPYKSLVMDYLDHIDQDALDLGAVNTIKVEKQNKLTGHNTDTYGFMHHLNTSVPLWKNKEGYITIIGAGGASRAIIWSFLRENKVDIKLFNRSKERAFQLIEDMKKLFPKANITFYSDLSEAIKNSSLLVNCSSLGMKGQPRLEINLEKMKDNSIVYDIVYSPLNTELLSKAKRLNLIAIDGLGMLINQAAPAFEMWHNKKAIVNEKLREYAISYLKKEK